MELLKESKLEYIIEGKTATEILTELKEKNYPCYVYMYGEQVGTYDIVKKELTAISPKFPKYKQAEFYDSGFVLSNWNEKSKTIYSFSQTESYFKKVHARGYHMIAFDFQKTYAINEQVVINSAKEGT